MGFWCGADCCDIGAVRRGDALAQPEPQAEVILPEPVYDENGEEQYVRMPIPHAALYLENGRHTNLRALAKNQARVLVFVSATCAGCVKFLKTMTSWQERLPQVALHPVYRAWSRCRPRVMRVRCRRV